MIQVIFSFTRYPATDRNAIKRIMARMYAGPAGKIIGSTARKTIRTKKPETPITTSRSRASINRVLASKRYMHIREPPAAILITVAA